MSLNREEWIALGAFADDDMEPIEEVFFTLRDFGVTLASEQLLALMFQLYRKGFVTIQQSPLFDQEFTERVIHPSTPGEVVGDLGADFRKFHAHGDYVQKIEGAGVPFGIYFRLTELGGAEYAKPEYASFLPEE